MGMDLDSDEWRSKWEGRVERERGYLSIVSPRATYVLKSSVGGGFHPTMRV